jgi:hypothetical protein
MIWRVFFSGARNVCAGKADEAAVAAPEANAFLAKPFSLGDLLTAVKRELTPG